MQKPITKEQIQAARQWDLLTYLRCQDPSSLRKTGPNEYRTVQHGSLVINPDGVWHWFAGGIGGRSTLDYLTKVEKMSFTAAVTRILSLSRSSLQPLPELEEGTRRLSSTHPKEFKLPTKCRTTTRIQAYLTGRGIDADLVRQCIENGSIYESEPHHNVVFVGRDGTGEARFASLRGTLPGSRFRMDVPGSSKAHNFLYVPPGCPPAPPWVALFESPIDALSFVTLNRRQSCCPISWDNLPCLSASGTAGMSLFSYLREHPQTDTIFLGFDADEAGHKGAQRIAKAIRYHPELSGQVRHIKSMHPNPAYGKDYNEVLQHLSQQPRPPTRHRFADHLANGRGQAAQHHQGSHTPIRSRKEALSRE